MKKKEYIQPEFILVCMDEDISILTTSKVSKTGDFGDDNHVFDIIGENEGINAEKYTDKKTNDGWEDF